MANESHYPNYDVLRNKEEWDEHTRSIVLSRYNRTWEFQFLTLQEVEILHLICSRLVDDTREDLVAYMVKHIDQTLVDSPGEGQRKVGVLPAHQLIREGLQWLNEASIKQYMLGFTQLEKRQQLHLLDEFSRGNFLQKEWFKKLLSLATESYYSHPTVWSEIGYGGPAYPRGYVRAQLGQLDPWEAQPE
ncbi:gluconate 2-dehydrogenase subunit 3 family protein [Ammoniphilus sp. YIM 78166]|uniref:gluconate 2-dehydrogenase subunit 3 family protein n=1 Tax=Ammoniphilus sp. YIM 78166 TaxID=1644106 RepID=UPI0010703D68|nr:gluconate 2-dehydrogenase subunit 3 family protein [Ammoniphilus sp. YIM 78166]